MTTTRIIATPAGFATPEDIAGNVLGSTLDHGQFNEPTSRVVDGATRFSVGQESTQQESTARYSHTIDGTAGGSVLATRARINGADTVELIPGSPSSRTQLSMALRDGLIRQIAPGVYEDVRAADGTQRTLSHAEHEQAQATQQRQQQEAQEVAIDTAGVFSAEEDAIFRTEFADVPEAAFRATASLMVNAVVLDQGLESAAQRLAVETGIDPERALEKVATAMELQQRIIDRAMARVGLSGQSLEAFYDETRTNPNRLQNALQFLVAGRDVSQFQSWGREFAERQGLNALVQQARTTDTDSMAGAGVAREVSNTGNVSQTSALQAAGFEVGQAADGTPVVRHDGGSWRTVSSLLNNKGTPAPQRAASTPAAPARTHSSHFTSAKPLQINPRWTAV